MNVGGAQVGQYEFLGDDLAGKTVLIIGYGSIGAADRSPTNTVWSENPSPGPHSAQNPEVFAVARLRSLLPEADIVVAIVPLTAETHGLIGAAEIALMKRGALLVNGARGPIVSTEALVEALQQNRLRAVLDVTDPEPLPPRPSAMVGSQLHDHPSRRRFHSRVYSSRLPIRREPGAKVHCRGKARKHRHRLRLLISAKVRPLRFRSSHGPLNETNLFLVFLVFVILVLIILVFIVLIVIVFVVLILLIFILAHRRHLRHPHRRRQIVVFIVLVVNGVETFSRNNEGFAPHVIEAAGQLLRRVQGPDQE